MIENSLQCGIVVCYKVDVCSSVIAVNISSKTLMTQLEIYEEFIISMVLSEYTKIRILTFW